ncbi:glycosyltransferase 87 family protein [soil metagenome]
MPDRLNPRALSRSVRVLGSIVLLVAVALYVAAYLKWPSLASQVDLLCYRFGALRVWAGQDLYSVGMTGNSRTMLFDYTPFAALAFLPLSGLSQAATLTVGLLVNVLCVGYIVRRMLTVAGVTKTAGLWALTALLTGAALWLEPVRLSLQLGQINIVVMTIVIADVLAPASRKWAGIGIGIAAGIKLTPALFVIFLFVTGRRRAAATAAATFVGTVAAGFALLPADSRFFWLQGGFDDDRRISSDPLANTSLRGLLLRLHWATGWETVAAGALAVVALALATVAWRRGQVILAVAIVGMGTAAVSPFSWSHHWVWFVPLLVHLGLRAYGYRSRGASVALWLIAACFGGWFVASNSSPPQAGLLSLRHPGLWDQLLPASYLVMYLLVLAVSAYTFWRSQVWQQESPFHASSPSLSATAAISRAAIESAHDQPNRLLSTSPTSNTADR